MNQNKQAEALRERIAELEEDLQYVERWAVHHGSKPSFSAKEALSAIQYYPRIQAITDSYADGKRPDIFNPYARIAELEAELTAAPQAVPEGWQIVPKRLNQNMADAAKCTDARLSVWKYDDVYKAMLANAPTPPTTHPTQQGLDAKDAERYRFIKNHSLILSGGTREFGWPISPFGVECDRYIDKELAAQAKQGGL